MNRDRVQAGALGLLGVSVVLGALLYVVGVDAFLRELGRARSGLVALVVLTTLGWLAAWGYSLRTVLGIIGVKLSLSTAFFVLNGAVFANNITPFGQAGGEPVTALLISNTAAIEYERGLAAIASVDSLNVIPSTTLALIGAFYFATRASFSRQLQYVIVSFVALVVVGTSVSYLAYRNQSRLRLGVIRLLTPIGQRLGRVVPGFTPPTREGIAARVRGFGTAIRRVARSRRGLVVALVASTAGWIFQMLGLWLAFLAIGSSIPFALLLFVVPMGAVAGITPLPGGAGGIEAMLVGLLSALTGAVALETILAAVIIFRGVVYWLPTAIGGTVVSRMSVDAL